MEDIELGSLLKKAREEKGLTIDDIQEETKIRKKYLEAIEENNFDILPGNVYLKVFVKGYAREVGLNYQKLLENFEILNIEEKKESNLHKDYLGGTKVSHSNSKSRNKNPFKIVFIILISLFLIAAAVYSYQYFSSSDIRLLNQNKSENEEKIEENSQVLRLDEEQSEAVNLNNSENAVAELENNEENSAVLSEENEELLNQNNLDSSEINDSAESDELSEIIVSDDLSEGDENTVENNGDNNDNSVNQAENGNNSEEISSESNNDAGNTDSSNMEAEELSAQSSLPAENNELEANSEEDISAEEDLNSEENIISNQNSGAEENVQVNADQIDNTVKIEADDTVWITVDLDGENAFSGILEAGDVEEFEIDNRFYIKIGNGSAITASINGQEYGPWAGNGEIAETEIIIEEEEISVNNLRD